MEGQVSGLGSVQPLLILYFFSTLFLSLFKRKTSSVMGGLLKRDIDTICQMVSTELIYIINVFECKVFNLVDVEASNQTVSIKCHCLTKAGNS